MKRKTSPTTRASAPSPDSPSPELWRQVLRTQLYDDILQPTGLRSTQVVILVALAAEGDMSLSRLARELLTSPSTLSRTLVPLERDGLVEHSPHGKRGKVVRLTGQGEHALLAAMPYWQKAQEKFTALVGTSAWTDLNERLAKTVAAIRT
jgi:DNA-binding MarR family transcriptional regulator